MILSHSLYSIRSIVLIILDFAQCTCPQIITRIGGRSPRAMRLDNDNDESVGVIPRPRYCSATLENSRVSPVALTLRRTTWQGRVATHAALLQAHDRVFVRQTFSRDTLTRKHVLRSVNHCARALQRRAHAQVRVRVSHCAVKNWVS